MTIISFLFFSTNKQTNKTITKNNEKECLVKIYKNLGKNEKLKKQIGYGFYTKNGLFITNKHVFKNLGDIYEITGKNITGTIGKIWINSGADIAYFKINQNIECKNNFSTNQKIFTGEQIYTKLYKNGNLKILSGKIIGIKNNLTINKTIYNNIIITDLILEHGNSGSPLYNNSGDIIGINTAISNSEQKTYAIQITF